MKTMIDENENELVCYEDKNVKISVINLGYSRMKNGEDIEYIATYWDKNDCLEVDRNVYEFATRGGATTKAFDLLSQVTTAYVAEAEDSIDAFISNYFAGDEEEENEIQTHKT